MGGVETAPKPRIVGEPGVTKRSSNAGARAAAAREAAPRVGGPTVSSRRPMIEQPVSEAGAGAELASHSFPALARRGDSRVSVTCVTRPAARGPPTARAPPTWPRPGPPPSLPPRDAYP